MARSSRAFRVLMLGWEYPPRFAGGLGKACRGLSLALARQGAQLTFVLPTFPEKIVERHLQVVGARETLAEAGWKEGSRTPSRFASGEGGVEWFSAGAKLYPYGAHPEGPAPKRVLRAVGQTDYDTELDESPRAEVTSQQTTATTTTTVTREIYGRNFWSEIERYCFAVRQMGETHDVDVVHAHDWMTFPAAFEFHRVTGAPVFLHVHATEYDRSGENVSNEIFRIEREGFRKATHIFAVSKYTAGIIHRLYGVPKRKISVVYNAPDDEAKELSVPLDLPREPNVIFLGRLTFQKGPDHFLKAAALVSQAEPNARFVFCGTGDMFDKLRSLAHRLGIESRVHFAGFVEPGQVDEILRRSRVLVMPSVSEPFGLVALEAVHNGIPVILSKQSGVREVLSRALQVDFWDHERLADQILAALRLRSLSMQLVSEGMNEVKELSWDKSARKVIEKYHRWVPTTYAQSVGGANGR